MHLHDESAVLVLFLWIVDQILFGSFDTRAACVWHNAIEQAFKSDII